MNSFRAYLYVMNELEVEKQCNIKNSHYEFDVVCYR